jgi:hypothetical protein
VRTRSFAIIGFVLGVTCSSDAWSAEPPKNAGAPTSTVSARTTSPSAASTTAGAAARTLARDGLEVLRGRLNVAELCLRRFVGPRLIDPRVDRYVPVLEGSGIAGVKVFGAKDDGYLAAFGIAPGDAVRSIAGRSLTSPEEGRALLSELEREVPAMLAIEVTRRPARPGAAGERHRIELHVSREPSDCRYFEHASP